MIASHAVMLMRRNDHILMDHQGLQLDWLLR